MKKKDKNMLIDMILEGSKLEAIISLMSCSQGELIDNLKQIQKNTNLLLDSTSELKHESWRSIIVDYLKDKGETSDDICNKIATEVLSENIDANIGVSDLQTAALIKWNPSQIMKKRSATVIDGASSAYFDKEMRKHGKLPI